MAAPALPCTCSRVLSTSRGHTTVAVMAPGWRVGRRGEGWWEDGRVGLEGGSSNWPGALRSREQGRLRLRFVTNPSKSAGQGWQRMTERSGEATQRALCTKLHAAPVVRWQPRPLHMRPGSPAMPPATALQISGSSRILRCGHSGREQGGGQRWARRVAGAGGGSDGGGGAAVASSPPVMPHTACIDRYLAYAWPTALVQGGHWQGAAHPNSAGPASERRWLQHVP